MPGKLKLLLATRRFAKNKRGSVAVLFGLILVPLAFIVGAALDYSGAADLNVRLQRATDATSLQLCQMTGTPTSALVQSTAAGYMQSYMGATAVSIESVTYTPFPRSIVLTTSALFKTSVVGGLSNAFKNLTIRTSAGCASQLQTYEIALVLDNTGSMANSSGGVSKMQALQAAATNFVNSVFGDSAMGPNTKISLVPFAATVSVNPNTYRTASWVDTMGLSTFHWSFLQGGAVTATALRAFGLNSRLDYFDTLKASVPAWSWAGCFESIPYPANVQDTKPTASDPDSYYVPMMAPDESGQGGAYTHSSGYTTILSANSYMDDTNSYCLATSNEATLTGQGCKYRQIRNARTSNGNFVTGPNFSCAMRPLTRLTTSQTTLTTEISLMQPDGNTDIHEGLMWGWRAVSPNSVFGDGVPYSQPFNNKIIILMTDGMNTWTANPWNPTLKSLHSAYGFYNNPDGTTPNARLPPGNANPTNDVQARAAIDQMTLEACQNARAANVTIYTIGFSVSGDPIDTQGLNLLRSCAGSSDHAFVATDSSAIDTVFQQIKASIGKLRLTR